MKSRARIVSGLAALAALFLAPLAEASLTRVTSPAIEAPALTLTVAAPEPAPEPSEFSLFEGHELSAAAAESSSAESFHPLAAVTLLSEDARLELEPVLTDSYPKTRIGGLRLFSQRVFLVSRRLSVEVRWGCEGFSSGIAEGIGIWLSQDPMGDKDSPNLYAFVGMRPHEKTDPLGLLGFGQWVRGFTEDAFASGGFWSKTVAVGLTVLDATFQFASVGATKKIDAAQEQLDRGEITRGEYWKKTGIAAGQTAATYAGGAGASVLATRVAVKVVGAEAGTAFLARTGIGAFSGAAGGVAGLGAADVVGIAAGTQDSFSSGVDYFSAAATGAAFGFVGGAKARSTQEFLQDVAERAESKVGGTGSRAGTLKHAYAEKLINRYQRRFGPVGEGLSTEESYQGGTYLGRQVNVRGSVRLDVVEGPVDSPSAIYDFKFTINPNPTIPQARINQIRAQAGLAPDVLVEPIHP